MIRTSNIATCSLSAPWITLLSELEWVWTTTDKKSFEHLLQATTEVTKNHNCSHGTYFCEISKCTRISWDLQKKPRRSRPNDVSKLSAISFKALDQCDTTVRRAFAEREGWSVSQRKKCIGDMSVMAVGVRGLIQKAQLLFCLTPATMFH